MKHTLKSLLITSVLTLPTVLGSDTPGSDALADKENSGGSQTNAQTQSPLHGLILRQKDVLEICLTGLIDNDKFTLGSLSLRDLYALSRVSQGMHKLVQPILDFVKKWTETDPIVRLLQDKCTPEDETVFPLFVHSRTKFDRLVEILFSRFNSRVLIKDKRALAQLINNSGFTDAQKIILIGGLPNATPEEVSNAAKISHWGGYHEIAANLYERLVYSNSSNEKLFYFTGVAAEELLNLGYYEKAAKAYVKYFTISHRNNKVLGIQSAANKLRNKCHSDTAEQRDYQEMAANLYGQLANHPGAKVWDIQRAADQLRELGNRHPEGSPRRKLYHEKAEALNASALAKLAEQQQNY